MERRYWATLIAVLTTISLSASAQPLGVSYLGICNPTWQCGRSIKALEGQDTIRTGWIEGTFGNSCDCADRLLQDPRPKEVRVHLANGPCMRNRRCGRHEVFYGYTIASSNRAIKRGDRRLAKRFERVAVRTRERIGRSRGPLTCYVSPVLESDNDAEARKILHRLAGAYLPGCTLVDNPLRGKCIRGTVCERHGPDPGLSRPCIADLDGAWGKDVSISAFVRNTRRCDMSLLWTPELNCNDSRGHTFIDPRKRNCGNPGANWRGLMEWLNRKYR